MRATQAPPLQGSDAELFAACRLRAARMQPYMAAAVFSLVPVSAPGYGTFGVDRWWRVYLDMDQARRWGVEAAAAVLLHEANHVVRDHHGRADRAGVTRGHHASWNLATDAAINDDLVAEGHPLPDPVLPSSLGLEAGGVEEAYFRRIIEREPPRASAACGSGAGGEILPIEIDDDTEDHDTHAGGASRVARVDDLEAGAIRRGVAHEITTAQARGIEVSPGLARWAQALLEPQVSWRTLLRAAVGRPLRSANGRRHPSWQRPDRRCDVPPDVLRPGLRRERAVVAVVVDTSASMSAGALGAAVTELDAICRRCDAEVTVIACDRTAATAQRVRHIGQLHLVGGGGTDMRVGIDAAAAFRPVPSVIVVLTDGLTPWPRQAAPGSCLVAVVIGRRAALPTGVGITAIRIDEP